MAQVINTNIASLNAQRNLNRSQNSLQTSLQRLSSGLRINSAKDDAAGLAISERMTTQIRGLNQAIRNANDGISFAQTAEGALSTVGDALQRIRELAVQSANDSNSASDRQALNNEVQALIAEVNRVANATEFNGQKVLDGSLSTLVFQVGANQNQTISVSGVDSRASVLGAASVEGSSVTLTGLSSTLTTNDVKVNGVSVDLADVIAASNPTVDDVIDAINLVQADSGVQALKAKTVTTPELNYDTGTNGATLTINNVDIVISSGTSIDQAVDQINALSVQTGVTASAGGSGGLVLSNTDGSDIVLATSNASVIDVDGGGNGTTETYMAGIILATEVEGSITLAGTEITALGLSSGAQTLTKQALNSVNVLTRDNANDALLALDFALQQVNGLRAELGAVQTRFESTISNLSVTVENLEAARSRIRDADFAQETANLTRAQILQQAGVAMLAQANVLPQNVLALLQ